MTRTYTKFAAEHAGKFLAAFDAGLGEEGKPTLDVLVYDTAEDADLDEDEGTNRRAIARADVIDDRE